MKYTIYDTLQDAETANATGFPSGCVTKRWSDLRELKDGRWAGQIPVIYGGIEEELEDSEFVDYVDADEQNV